MLTTAAQIAKAGAGRHNCGPGLYLIVSRDGYNRRWAFRYTKPSTGRVTELGLGRADLLTLAEARDKAHEHRKSVARGEDPVEQKREAKLTRVTFADLAAEFIAAKEPGWRTVGHKETVTRLLLRHAKALGPQTIARITANEVEAAVRPLWSTTPYQAKRTLTAVRQVLDFGLAKGLCERNPADWRLMKHRFPRVANNSRHFTAMDYVQIPDFVRKLHVEQQREEALSPYVIEFLLLTAARGSEVCRMRWEEVDLDLLVWTIPAARTKSQREHRVPLCERTMALLMEQRQLTTGEYVWPGRKGDKPFSNRSLYRWLTVTMGIPVTVHGFRSTFRDWAGDMTHYPRNDIEECLSHMVGDATERAYRRKDAFDKRRVIMDAWAGYCAGSAQNAA